MSKLEYLNPSDWSLHVIDGESECVPDDWILVPEGAEILILRNGDLIFFKKKLKKVVGDPCDFLYLKNEDLVWSGTLRNPLKFHDDEKIVWTRKMKEYLIKRDGKYELVEAYHLDGGIEVPEGAQRYTEGGFFKNKKTWFSRAMRCWVEKENNSWIGFNDILWQRNPSLNDQYAEIEEVRQENSVSNPKHYTSHPSGIECIEITRHHDFAIGNAIKYLWRAGLKDSDNEIQDLEKAVWYIQDKIKQLKGEK